MNHLKDAIAKLSSTGDSVYSIVATVKSVNKTARTCWVVPLNGEADILDARLQANTEGVKGGVVYPKKGSKVVITFLNKNTAYVALVSEIDRIKLSVEGIDLKQQIDDLLKLNGNILDTLINFKMLTNMGATIAVTPDIVLKLQQYKTDNTQIKQNFAKIFE